MATITIGAVTYTVYGAQAEANAYFSAASHGAPWLAAASSLRNQALVTATRVFDRTTWQGEPTQPVVTQLLEWPRIGLVDRNGVVVPSGAIPQDVIDGNFEYALDLINQPSTQTDDLRGTNTKSTKLLERVEGAITVSSENTFFIPTIGRLAPFPNIVQEYVGLWLGSSEGGTLSFVSGADVVSPLAGDAGDFGFTGDGLP